MKQIIKLGEGKYIQLYSYGERSAHPLEPFIVGFFVTAIATITVGAVLGTDVTKLIQMPNHSTQPAQPLKP
jgi:hypothetical protein